MEDFIGKTFSDTYCMMFFLGQSPKGIEKLNKQMGSNQTYKLLHSIGNHKLNYKTTYRMGEKYLQTI